MRYQPSESVRDALVSRVQSLLTVRERDRKDLTKNEGGSSNGDPSICLTDLGLIIWAVKRSRIILPSAVYEGWKGACINMIRDELKLEGSGREILDRYMKGIEDGEGSWDRPPRALSPDLSPKVESSAAASRRPQPQGLGRQATSTRGNTARSILLASAHELSSINHRVPRNLNECNQ